MIYIDKLKKEVGTRELFFIEKLSINQDEKIGLIGNNGVGKTTLFRILLWIDTEYSGYVDVKMKISSLLNNEKNDLKVQKSYSPGEYQRLRLDEVLLKEESFLLIDEPTSHLDIDQKEKLVKELKNRNKGFIIISHDRDFINQTCDKIFELSNKSLEVYNGNYTFYLEERIKRQKFLQREYFNYISEKNRLLSVANDIKKQSSRVKTTPKRMGNSEARLHKMGGQENKKKLDKQVKAIESRINQLEVKERPKEEKAIELSMPENKKIHSKILIRSEKLNKRFGDKVIFNNAKLEIENNRKIALLGINGSGKTTLINMIINKEVWVHPNLKIGYYSQLGERLNPLNSILENVLETSIYDQSITRIILARLGFKRNDVFKDINILSDGERAKVKLAKLITSDFNFIIMDEPTNFLDIRAIEALEGLLKYYDRPILFVTHDISFINNLADGLLMIENKKLNRFIGNLSQYRESKARSSKKTSSKDFLIDFRLTAISNRLAMEIPKSEREDLEEEYKKLLSQKNK